MLLSDEFRGLGSGEFCGLKSDGRENTHFLKSNLSAWLLIYVPLLLIIFFNVYVTYHAFSQYVA